MKPISILYFAVAMFFPIIFFTVIMNNYNENHPLAVFALCGILWAAAGYLAGKNIAWIGWSILLGCAEAALLVWAV